MKIHANPVVEVATQRELNRVVKVVNNNADVLDGLRKLTFVGFIATAAFMFADIKMYRDMQKRINSLEKEIRKLKGEETYSDWRNEEE